MEVGLFLTKDRLFITCLITASAKNRGVHPIDFTTPVKMPRPGDAAFGVNIAASEFSDTSF